MLVTDKYIFFWKGWLSNWAKSEFDVEIGLAHPPTHFYNVEQYFMYIKALTFNDKEQCENILATDSPKDAKAFGRKVKNYDNAIWEAKRLDVMKRGIYHKFTQNPSLLKKLLDPIYDGKEFVEASPFDTIWGIGMDENNEQIHNKENWLGLNLMGQAINDVRERLKDEKWLTL